MDDHAAGQATPWGPPWSHRARRRLTVPVAVVLVAELIVAAATVHRSPAIAAAYLGCVVLGGLALVLLRRHPGPAVAVVGATAVGALLLVPVPPVALLPFLLAIVAPRSAGPAPGRSHPPPARSCCRSPSSC